MKILKVKLMKEKGDKKLENLFDQEDKFDPLFKFLKSSVWVKIHVKSNNSNDSQSLQNILSQCF